MSSILRGFLRGAKNSFPRMRALMIICWRFSRSHSSCCAVISQCRTRWGGGLLCSHIIIWQHVAWFKDLSITAHFGSYTILLTARMISKVRPSILKDKIEQAIAQTDGTGGFSQSPHVSMAWHGRAVLEVFRCRTRVGLEQMVSLLPGTQRQLRTYIVL